MNTIQVVIAVTKRLQYEKGWCETSEIMSINEFIKGKLFINFLGGIYKSQLGIGFIFLNKFDQKWYIQTILTYSVSAYQVIYPSRDNPDIRDPHFRVKHFWYIRRKTSFRNMVSLQHPLINLNKYYKLNLQGYQL